MCTSNGCFLAPDRDGKALGLACASIREKGLDLRAGKELEKMGWRAVGGVRLRASAGGGQMAHSEGKRVPIGEGGGLCMQTYSRTGTA